MNNDLEVCSRPGDEVLGCGGTIACHEDAGDQLQVLIAAEGASPRLDSHERLGLTSRI
jgi:LmbE family N-acetylglucosaminyl deacetylase